MTWYPTRLLPSLALTAAAGLVLACTHSGATTQNQPAPRAAPPPPAANTMTADEPAREHATSLDQMLAGRLSGVSVTPGPSGGIVVRMGGPHSFYSQEDPLFVVDGMPVEAGRGGTLSWLRPQDIESITALKDPSQTAIYGVRGANGVIVIRTKGSH